MTLILGLSALYHDSAAAVVRDGEVVAAAQEERFTRRKHDSSFPRNAVDFVLKEAGARVEDLDFVGFYEKPLTKFDRLLETYLDFAPRGFRSFAKALPVWLHTKLRLSKVIRASLPGAFRRRIVYTQHHESHAASAFFPSPFERAAVLTMDGVGEWATATIGLGEGSGIRILRELRFPHSLGLLYSAFTHHCGFRVNSGEYKLMGLAPYGEPRFERVIRERLIDLKDDGSFRLDMRHFRYCQGLRMTSPAFDRLFEGPARAPEGPLTQREMDLAASIQKVTEDVMLRMARTAKSVTGADALCLAGGVALNCVGNGRIVNEGIFRDVWIQPAANDAGGALGVALLIWHVLLGKERAPRTADTQRGSFLGPRFTDDQVEATLARVGGTYRRYDDSSTAATGDGSTATGEDALVGDVAAHLAAGKVVGWFQGRMEFGPRALGGRSILGDPRDADMQSRMNLKIKFRESFRPFAPAVLEERAREWFDLPQGCESPYMLLTAPVAARRRLRESGAGGTGLDRLRERRSEIPAVTHVDFSARLQTVDAQRNPRFHALLLEFERRTGCPVLVNTSFNVRGEPIVCTPDDAWRCFMATDMDVLVMENCVALKSDQPRSSARPSREPAFALD